MTPAEIDQMIGALRDRDGDKLCLDAADTIEEMVQRSTASTDKPAAIEYRGIALAAHNRATPVAPDASTPVQRPHE